MVLDAGAGGGGGLVDVDARDGGAGGGGGGAADGVVEEEDALGVGDVREEKRLDFGVVVLLDGGVGEEVVLRGGGDVGQGGEGVGVEGVGGFVAANVGDGDGNVDVAEVALGVAFRGGFDVVEWFGAVFGGFVEV